MWLANNNQLFNILPEIYQHLASVTFPSSLTMDAAVITKIYLHDNYNNSNFLLWVNCETKRYE